MNHPATSKLQTAFLVGLGTLFLLFCVLLGCGNIGNQSRVIYEEGEDFMADALLTEEYARGMNPYAYDPDEAHVPFKDANYLPIAYGLFNWMDAISGRDITTPRAMAVAIVLTAISLSLLLTLCACLLQGTRAMRIGFALALMVSGTALFSFERGNIILLSAALCAFFLLFYRSENKGLRELSFVALAVAAALKIYPALYGVLLLGEKRWKEAVRLAIYGVAACFVPFFFVEGGFACLPLLFENFGAHKAYYNRFIYPRFGFRLFASMTYDVHWSNAFLEDQLWKLGDKMFRFMPAVDTLLAGGCALTALLDKEDWKRAAAVGAVIVNYPINSGAYAALYLFPAAALYLSCDTLKKRDWIYLALFLVIFSPLQIELPYTLLGLTEPVMINTSGILRNLSAYALYLIFAVQGFQTVIRLLRSHGRREKKTALKQA